MKRTVADVIEVLASVARICECNNRVVFDEEGSYIEDKQSGRRTPMHKKERSLCDGGKSQEDHRRTGIHNKSGQ